jgi:hypothetical protein
MSAGRMLGAAIAALATAGLEACGGASADPGLSASLQVSGAQFAAGAIPGDTGGPRVLSVAASSAEIVLGQGGNPLRGALELSAQAVAIGLAGDIGHWIVPAAPPSFETPGALSFEVDLAFSATISTDPIEVDVRASDASGRFGPQSSITFRSRPLSAPAGKLVFTLRWDTEADLDIHVIDPSGSEVWARNINSYPKPPVGQPPDPAAVAAGGILDFDSNAACTIDGRREENVVYSMAPPMGHFIVRVDAFSMCGQSAARWTVEARHDDQVFASAQGTSTEADTRFSHDRGAGVLALEIDEP